LGDVGHGRASLDFDPIAAMLRLIFFTESSMPTIGDVVGALRQRAGVEAAVVLGRDGLLIDGRSIPALDTEALAAHAPSIVSAAEELGTAAGRGTFATGVLEYPGTLAIVSVLSADAILLVLAREEVDLGALVFELRRNRERMAALV
jgi:predicted regulator of Ras-like GTPase activity (Roadblock/LC7/MglB family)